MLRGCHAHLGTREQKVFCFFESSDGHFTRDGRKPLQKVFECLSALQIVEQRLDRHARTAKHRSSTKNIRIFDNDSHGVIVSCEWPRGGMALGGASLRASGARTEWRDEPACGRQARRYREGKRERTLRRGRRGARLPLL